MTEILLLVFVPMIVVGLIAAAFSPAWERAKERAEARSWIEADKRHKRVMAEVRRLRDEQNTR